MSELNTEPGFPGLNKAKPAYGRSLDPASGKTKIAVSLLLGLITLAFIFKNESTSPGAYISKPPAAPANNTFLIGAMTDGWQANYSKLTDTLHFNMWHRYITGGMESNGFNIHGWTASDELNAPINDYKTDIQNIIRDNDNNGMRTLMERPKITRLAFGERSDYQCEVVPPGDPLWFYAYSNSEVNNQNITDVTDNDPDYGEGKVVKQCLKDPAINSPGNPVLICSGLKANREQVNMDGRWEGDRSYGWIVKPRIRADKNYVDNHSDEPICRIDVINYDEDLIKSTIIRARNLKITGQYDGKYREDGFDFNSQLGDSDLTFEQPEAINYNPRSAGWFVPDGVCHVDFKVYWYGNCNMWIDYVRVDNDVADRLFKGLDDIWLQWEATNIGNHTSSPYKFYIEEFEFNNIPCMSYVSRRLKSYNPNIGLMCDLNYSNYNTMMPFPDWDHLPYLAQK